MINKSIPRLIKRIKNPSLKLLSNIFSFIYRHPYVVGILFLFIFLVLTNPSDTINLIYRHKLIVSILFLFIFLVLTNLSDTINLIYRYMLIVGILIFLLFIAYIGYREYHKEVFIIEPFEVPEYLKKNGLTGKAIANKINDKIIYIRQEAATSMEAIQFSTKSVDPLPEIVVPGTGISIRPFIRYFKSEFSPYKPNILTGELFVENDLLYLTTRVLGSPEKTFDPVNKEKLMEVSDSNKIRVFDNLMLEVAMHTYRYTQPYTLASYYYSLKKPDDALEIVKEMTRYKKGESLVRAYNLWAVILVNQKKYDEAIKKYNLALYEDSESVLTYNNLGSVYYREGDYSKAKESYEKAIDLEPQFSPAYHNLGKIYYDEGDYSKAKEYYEKAIDLDPQFSPAYNNLGTVYYSEGDYSKAKESYEKAIDLDPQFSNAYNNLGSVYYSEGDYSKAKEYYEKAIELDPQYSLAYYNLGDVYYREGDYSKEKESYEKAIDLDPQYSLAYYNLGDVYYREGDYSKAKEMYEKVIEIDPNGLGKKAREKIENLPN